MDSIDVCDRVAIGFILEVHSSEALGLWIGFDLVVEAGTLCGVDFLIHVLIVFENGRPSVLIEPVGSELAQLGLPFSPESI